MQNESSKILQALSREGIQKYWCNRKKVAEEEIKKTYKKEKQLQKPSS